MQKRVISKIKYLIDMIKSCKELFHDGVDNEIIDTLNEIIDIVKESDVNCAS